MSARVAALVLAAGLSTRMGAVNKLLVPVDGTPLVRHAVRAAVGSSARPVVVVTGHEAVRVEAALAGLDVVFARNPAPADGMSASLAAGLAALPVGLDGCLVALGDMPGVGSAAIDSLIDAFAVDPRRIVAAGHDGRRGNPVLWPAHLLADLGAVSGDKGGRDLLERHAGDVSLVEIGPGAFRDVDTAEDIAHDAREGGGRAL